jgi:hypothetical protein
MFELTQFLPGLFQLDQHDRLNTTGAPIFFTQHNPRRVYLRIAGFTVTAVLNNFLCVVSSQATPRAVQQIGGGNQIFEFTWLTHFVLVHQAFMASVAWTSNETSVTEVLVNPQYGETTNALRTFKTRLAEIERSLAASGRSNSTRKRYSARKSIATLAGNYFGRYSHPYASG